MTLLALDHLEEEELIEFIKENCPWDRSGGGMLYFTELKDKWDYTCNPFS